MKKSLLLAALLIAATAAVAQTASTPARTPADSQAVSAKRTDKPRHGGNLHGRMDAKKMAERQLTRLDTDKDGKVSRQEYLARQSEAFSKTDANSDGFVTPAEMAARHDKHHAERSAQREARKAAHAKAGQEAQKPAATPAAPAPMK